METDIRGLQAPITRGHSPGVAKLWLNPFLAPIMAFFLVWTLVVVLLDRARTRYTAIRHWHWRA
jgi:hypothetical protein